MEMNRQFDRFAEVEIRDFDGGVKTIISNDFEIEFDYFKTIDQTQEDDSGRIRIYGLTPERIKSLQFGGGEVHFKCGYTKSSIDTLFIAYIARLYSQDKDNTTVTTIECSANLMNYYINGSSTSGGGSGGQKTMEVFTMELLKSLGFNNLLFILDNVPENRQKDVEDYIKTFAMPIAFVGSAENTLTNMMNMFGLGMRAEKDKDGSGKVVHISVLPVGVDRILKSIDNGYSKVGSNASKNKTSVNGERFNVLYSTLKADDDSNTIAILDNKTGLIESKTEYKIATAYVDQEAKSSKEDPPSKSNKTKNPAKTTKKSVSSDGDDFVSNSVLQGLVIKGGVGGQATQGGKVKSYTADFAAIVSQVIGNDLIRFTGFNDEYHRLRGGRHPAGQAFDLTIKSAHEGAPNQKNLILQAAVENGYRVKVLDEYNFPSKGATGGHLHVSVYGRDTDSTQPESLNNNLSFAAYRRTDFKINRKYNRVKALLNPLVKPQSMVAVLEKDSTSSDIKGSGDLSYDSVSTYQTYRVRSATYKGNNKRNDWVMELYCEDTETTNMSKEQLRRLAASSSSEEFEITEASNLSPE